MSNDSVPTGLRALMIPKAAAEYIGMNVHSFRKWVKKAGAKKLPRYQMGGRTFFKKEDLDSWIEGFKNK